MPNVFIHLSARMMLELRVALRTEFQLLYYFIFDPNFAITIGGDVLSYIYMCFIGSNLHPMRIQLVMSTQIGFNMLFSFE